MQAFLLLPVNCFQPLRAGGFHHSNRCSFSTLQSERIRYWGYPAEEYEVLTEDGYFLSLNRIPGGAWERSLRVHASILLVHGFIMEGCVWISNPPNQSLGFILADASYDVWIGNVRGNTWSQKHIKYTIAQKEFWNFSFHEMGIYDLPAMIGFILQKTGQEKIYYAGHSQGNTIGMSTMNSAISYVDSEILCSFFLQSRTDVYFSTLPDYTSLKNVLHWRQAFFSQTNPPFYKIEEITVPIAVWAGGRDWLARSKEIFLFLPRIHNLILVKEFPDWNHWDFIWGIDAHQRLYVEVLALMEQ
uniref:Partial AB-hydrolase lipase domain-containing protein n=1 Tax=Salvator merianae TaxID=96440 RepID=A0A8D0C2F2_SALMN